MKFAGTGVQLSTALLVAQCGTALQQGQDNVDNKVLLRRRSMMSRDPQTTGVVGLVLMYTGVTPSVPMMKLSLDAVNIVDLKALSLPDAKFSIDALTTIDSKSVIFSNGQCETAAPRSYCGNSGFDFNSCPDLILGANVTIAVTANSEKSCGGVTISTRSVTIHIIRSSLPAVPVPPVVVSSSVASTFIHVPMQAPKLVASIPTIAAIPVLTVSPPVSGMIGLVLMYTGVNPSIPVMKLSSESINIVDLQALSLPAAKFSIDAMMTTDMKSISFSNGQCETAAPLAYCGNTGYTFKPCPDLVLGANVTVSATAFSERYGAGVAVSTRSVIIRIIQSSTIVAAPSVPTTAAPAFVTKVPTSVLVVVPKISIATPGVATVATTSAPVVGVVVTKVTTSAPVVVPNVPIATPVVGPKPVVVGSKVPTSKPAAPVSAFVPTPTFVSPVQKCGIPRLTGEWDGNTVPYPIPVAEAQGTMIGNDFLITSGFNGGYTTATPATYALDMSIPNAIWRRMEDMPFSMGLTHLGVAVKGNLAFFCGGYTGGSLGVQDGSCFQYDHSMQPGMGQWTNLTSLPDGGRAGGGMIYDSTMDALIYAAGSHRPERHVPYAIDFQNTWMYSLRNPQAGWVPKADIPFKGNHMNFVTAHDETGTEHHYFFGGQHGDNEETGNTDDMYEYNAVTDVWTKRQSIPYPLGHAAATARAIGCGFIVAGGRLNTGLTSEISYYDIPTNTWTKIGDLTQEIHTNVCVIANGVLRCETGWATGTFSWQRSISTTTV